MCLVKNNVEDSSRGRGIGLNFYEFLFKDRVIRE